MYDCLNLCYSGVLEFQWLLQVDGEMQWFVVVGLFEIDDGDVFM